MVVVLGVDRKDLACSQVVAECQHRHTAKFVVADHQEQAD
jgi:hypothetical protein